MFGWILNLIQRPERSALRRRVPQVFRYLPIHRIIKNPNNARRYPHPIPFEELRVSIEKYGILVPVIARPDGDEYALIAGHRRVEAARQLNLPNVPAMVRRVSERRASELALIENRYRLDLSKLELLRAFQELAKRHPNHPRTDLAARMGINPATLGSAAFLSVLPEDLQEAVDTGGLSEDHVTRLADVGDSDARRQLIDVVREKNLDADDTRGLVDRVLRRRGRFVTTSQGRHFHTPHCAFAHAIPQALRRWVYSKSEGLKLGKIACMNCL